MQKAADHKFIHLLSDSTGETVRSLARSCLAQFEGVDATQRFWPMTNNKVHMERVIKAIIEEPGIVLYTIIDPVLSNQLVAFLKEKSIPSIAVLDPVLQAMSDYFQLPSTSKTGRQHRMNDHYFHRIDAMHFALYHDDGMMIDNLDEAEVILVGVSRTSKSPTCLYLGNMGIRAANIPFVCEVDLPARLFELSRQPGGPLIAGLTKSPQQLASIRQQRIAMITGGSNSDYANFANIKSELRLFRQIFARSGWPIIDVSHRSIEETAACVMKLLEERDKAR
ncbi:MAG: pyruvate, water dikinase regulatory protein [Pseudomonadota bacterium]